MMPTLDAGELVDPRPQLRGRCVGVEREQDERARPFALEPSTPADAHTNPCRVSAMTSGGRARTTSRASPRITSMRRGSDLARELSSTLGRLDAGEVDDATLDLRDRLLGDDEDSSWSKPVPRARGLGEDRSEIVSLLELGDPAERDHAELPRQGRPVTRIPAWPL